MSKKKLHEIKEKRNNIARQMRALHDEIGEKIWDEAQEKRFNDMNVELTQVDAVIQREERLLAIDSDDLNSKQEQRQFRGEETELRAATFDSFMRHGFENLNAEQRQLLNEMRAQGTNPNSAGGFTVPTEFRNRVTETMSQFGGVANIATVFTTESGAPIQWPTTNGTAEEGEMIAENTPAGEQDMSFGSASLGAKMMTSKIVRISNSLLRDSGVAIEPLIAKRLGSRLGRGEAKQLILGDGTGNNIFGLLAQALTGSTAATQTAVSYAELLALKHSVDPAYRYNPYWLFNDKSLLAIKLMKDTTGRPLWLPDVAGGTPATFDADKYQIDQAMPDIAAGKAAIAYGDFSALQIRRVNYMELKRLVEKYAEFDQTAFLMFHRFDALLEDKAAVKLLKMAA